MARQTPERSAGQSPLLRGSGTVSPIPSTTKSPASAMSKLATRVQGSISPRKNTLRAVPQMGVRWNGKRARTTSVSSRLLA